MALKVFGRLLSLSPSPALSVQLFLKPQACVSFPGHDPHSSPWHLPFVTHRVRAQSPGAVWLKRALCRFCAWQGLSPPRGSLVLSWLHFCFIYFILTDVPSVPNTAGKPGEQGVMSPGL